jgi:hypothetical protein
LAYYTVTYDLNVRKDYKRLTDELTRLDGAKVAMSVWLMERMNTDAFGLRNYLMQFIDADDRLVVIEFNKCPAYVQALPAGKTWIDQRFQS